MFRAWLPLLAVAAGCSGSSTIRAAPPEPVPGTEDVARADTVPSPYYGAQPDRNAPRAGGPAPAPGYTAGAPGPVTPSPGPYTGPRTTLALRRLGQWTTSGVLDARRQVIRDDVAWADLWAKLGGGTRPDVDFAREAVLVASSGERNTGGYAIQIVGVTEGGGVLTADVLESVPSEDCVTTMSLTQPVDVVVVPATPDRQFRFQDRRVTQPCS